MKNYVMVVDDDEFVRDALVKQITALGAHRVVAAADGHDAMQKLLGQGPFDLIFVDLQMPGSDGIEFLRSLAQRGDSTDLILTSGLDRKTLKTAESLAQAYALNVLGVLEKPIRSSAISRLLSKPAGKRASTKVAHPELSIGELSDALESGRLIPHYQPKVCALSGAPRSVEALARLRIPGRGLVMPEQFIPTAERCDLIDALTYTISAQAFADMAHWAARGVCPDMEINISAASLDDTDLPDRMLELAEQHLIEPSRVTFEMTESALIGSVAKTLDTLTRLRLKGFHLAGDDFGTRYSTFAQLKLLPLTELKVDISFVSRAVADPEARAIVESCLGLAQQFGLTTVAEGVEDEATAILMREMGANLLQGYWFSKPLSAQDLQTWWLDRCKPR